MNGSIDLNRTAEIAYTLVAKPSVGGTEGEAAFAPFLRDIILAHIDGGQGAVETKLVPSHGDPQVSSVAVLVRGEGRRCVLLSGHFDVVSTDDFGALEPLAFEPEALRAALLAELEDRSHSDRAFADLASGDFVPGRGILDMKSGLAGGITVLKRFSADPKPSGNLLFVATPDEENRSRGMRSLRDALAELTREWDLEIVGGINLDATDDNGYGSVGRSMYFGSVGKYAPFAYIVGVPTHAGYPFEGLSVHWIGAEILRAIEYNHALVDTAYGETSPPPMCLEARDFRESYNVTTPDRSWISFNWLQHSRRPAEVLDLFRAEVTAAVERSINERRTRAKQLGETAIFDGTVAVLTVAELRQRLTTVDPTGLERLEAHALALAGEESPLVLSRQLVENLVDAAGLSGPAVVVGFSSLFYPPVHVESADFRAVVEDAATQAAARHGMTIATREFFPGISDMSFLGRRVDLSDAATINDNCLSQQTRDDGGPGEPVFPVVNIGPWGRDCHKKLERVHARYAFEVLPDIVFEAASALLRNLD